METNKLNDFEILNKLGEGSFGQVFRVRRKQDKNMYVMKQINISKMSQRMKNEALNEVNILAKIDSSFIVRYHESFIEKNLLCIIMELCDGGDLHKYLKQQMGRPLQESFIWRILIQVTLGLAYLHQEKILHRDIKTMNIFLQKDQVRIGDLGVAKILTEQNNFAKTMVGTPYYLSPEMCEEKPYNEKSDIWALGCVIYELCTYKHPFEAQNQGALVLKIIRGRYNPIPNMYSPQLAQIIDMCLQKDYRIRPDAFQLLQQPNLIQFAQSLRLSLSLNQPHPLSRIIQKPVQSRDIVPPTPVPVMVKASQVVTKPFKSRPTDSPIVLEVKGKQEPIKETPIIQRKEVRDNIFKKDVPTPKKEMKICPPTAPVQQQKIVDWSDKVSELQKDPIIIKEIPKETPKMKEVPKQQVVVRVEQITQPVKKPVINNNKLLPDKKRVRKGAPQELGRQAQQPMKKKTEIQDEIVNEQLKLLKSKRNNKTIPNGLSQEDRDQVLNLPDIVHKQQDYEIGQPQKQLIDLSQYLDEEEGDMNIPTTEVLLNNDLNQYIQQEEQLVPFDDEQEQQYESDKENYSEQGSDKTEDFGDQDQDQDFLGQQQINLSGLSSNPTVNIQIQVSIDNEKLELNKKLIEQEKRQDELQQIISIKIQECVKELGSKQFTDIIDFFRNKMNQDVELNDRDQEEIDNIVQSKFVNSRNPTLIYTIYKILHFEIEIQNCKEKINELSKKLSS